MIDPSAGAGALEKTLFITFLCWLPVWCAFAYAKRRVRVRRGTRAEILGVGLVGSFIIATGHAVADEGLTANFHRRFQALRLDYWTEPNFEQVLLPIAALATVLLYLALHFWFVRAAEIFAETDEPSDRPDG
jgi:hypothetical protein